jgi:Recombinase
MNVGVLGVWAKLGMARWYIARSLEAQGATTRFGKTLWEATNIKTLLRRHTYAGTRYYNTVTTVTLSSGSASKKKRSTYIPKDRSEWIGVQVPAIISQELFDTVQERLRQNKQRYLRPAIQHLLGGMLKCGECGSAMYSYDRYYTKMTKEPKLGVYHKAAYNCIWRARAHAHCGEVIEQHRVLILPSANPTSPTGCDFHDFRGV